MKLLQKQKGNSWFLHVQKGRIFYKKQKLLIMLVLTIILCKMLVLSL